jgi:RHS repeat-associated protein
LSAFASANNQLSILQYDAAGNVTNDGLGNTPTYDAENRISTDQGYTYGYDASGFRVVKYSGSVGTMYWPDASGNALSETDLSGNITAEYMFSNGSRVARIDRPSGTIHFYFSDNLGSSNAITDTLGNPQQHYYYYPYGGLQSSTGSDPNHYLFTGKERDSESGLDNFGARYYTSNIGRFMSPDWAVRPTTVPYAVFGDPQSLNLYSYVRNDPVSRADADGHCPPQNKSDQKQVNGGGCPTLMVTVSKDSEPHVMHGKQPNPDLAKVGTTTTIKVTDAKGAAVVGAGVKENPVTTNNLTHTTEKNGANPDVVHTSEKGTISDVVAQNVAKEPVSTEEIQDHVNSTPYDKTTVQTLTITTQGSDGQTCTCSATYSEHMTNVGADGSLNEPNSSGVNYNLDIDPEPIQTTPQ